MVTTIQVSERAILLLKRLKEEMHAKSYEDVIGKLASQRATRSMAGVFKKKYKKTPLKEILEDIREKDDRF